MLARSPTARARSARAVHCEPRNSTLPGASGVIVGNSNMTMAEETRALIAERGGKAYTIGIDLAKPESAAKS